MKYIGIKIAFMLLMITSCVDTESQQNYDDLKSVKKGMVIKEVQGLMRNLPINTEPAGWTDSIFIQRYKSPPAASDYYMILFRKEDSTVVEVQWGD